MLLLEKLLKISLKKPKPWSQPCKNVLGKQTQPDILSQSKKKVKMNKTAANAGNLEANNSEIVQNIITTLQIRLDESHNLPQMRLDRSHNLIVLRTDPDTGSDIRLIYKLGKSLKEISSKVHEPKAHNEVIDNFIYENRWRKIIDKEL